MRRLLGILFSILLLIALLIGSAELLLYGTGSHWYEREYTKYNVRDHMIKEISMESLLDVTDQMMDYLRGDREDLVIYAERDGVMQEFFTDREKAHMDDVRGLFIGGLRLAHIALAICLVLLICLFAQRRRALRELQQPANVVLKTAAPDQLPKEPVPVRITLARCFTGTSLVLFAVAGVIAGLFASDFNKYFVIFHHIFFDNDLWILYPAKDDMINMLPEGFFSDTALAILIIYIVAVVLLVILSISVSRRYRRRQKQAA